MISPLRFVGSLSVLFLSLTDAVAAQSPAQPVVGNDNTHRSGIVAEGTVTVRLFAGHGLWRPEQSDGPALDVAAFGEEGGPLLTPGPLIRVADGSELVIRIKNGLSQPLYVHGLVSHPAVDDAVLSVPAGETREAYFLAGAPGTYFYWATTSQSALASRTAFESQLGGAFIVDLRGDTVLDRVFVMTQWNDSPRRDQLLPANLRVVYAINGFSWPHTEHLDERVGQPVQWRIVNLTQVTHPMHLHGFYFTVQAVGTGLRDSRSQQEDYRTVVTEYMLVGGTMQLTWTPDRSGNWLFHCHLLGHTSPALRFWKSVAPESHEHPEHQQHDAETAMAGLVMGIRVTGGPLVAQPVPSTAATVQHITLVMRKQPGYWHPEDAYAFFLESGGGQQPATAAVPGPLLVLHRGEPVEITLKNELAEATAIHWHGIELDSYFDGVPGWSGSSASTTPAIEPGTSFVVRFTPPRAGTFIYHTHDQALLQLESGLYGPIVVLEPGERFDAERDHVLVLGREGAKNTRIYDRFPVVANGSRLTQMAWKGGVPNRLRLINITTDFYGLNVSVIQDNQPVRWRAVAKDGADLPVSQQSVGPALGKQVTVGETYDFTIDVPPPGQRMWIDVRRASGEWVQQVPVRITP
jgi:FtsP/CotA-like multicopper oxidase with cupredoxin domain